MKKQYLLDSSFIIDLLNEFADGRPRAAMNWLQANSRAELWIGPVTMAEVLEGAADSEAVKGYLARYRWQANHRVHAERVAARQRKAGRRMGENDAWQAALAECMGATVLGHDRALKRLGSGYEDYRPRRWAAGQ